MASSAAYFDDEPHSPDTPPPISPSTLPQAEVPEVSLVEEEATTGVTFTPELWMQRRHWALSVLRKERVRSVLDIGCGAGALLETLVMPASTVSEPPIKARAHQTQRETQLPSPADSEDADDGDVDELFIERLGGIDPSPGVIPSALAVLTPPNPSSTFPPARPRWEPLQTELFLGGIEKYNSKMEGYEAITCLELIEHLNPNVLSRFGVVTMGTYRPRLMLITTPNFDFNAKFPRAITCGRDHDHGHGQEPSDSQQPKKGFVDPTGRTDRVFRHSDHKLEMTSGEFREWATGAAADWGYEVELGGVGISSKPSYYPADDPHVPNQPIYATQTAIFRLISAPMRSPRSVRSAPLPFMPGSSDSVHPHKLAGRFFHPITAPGFSEATYASTSSSQRHMGQSQLPRPRKKSPADVRERVREKFTDWNVGEVGLDEIWGVDAVAGACVGSKRYLVGVLGGWGDQPALVGSEGGEFEVGKQNGRAGLRVRWTSFSGKQAVNEGSRGQKLSDRKEAGADGQAGGW